METSHMLRTLITDPQQYYSASLRCYATAGKYMTHLPLTCDVAEEMRSCHKLRKEHVTHSQ
jgi:hypothetical protein